MIDYTLEFEEFVIPADAMFDFGIVGVRRWDFGRPDVFKFRCGCLLFARDGYLDWWNIYNPPENPAHECLPAGRGSV